MFEPDLTETTAQCTVPHGAAFFEDFSAPDAMIAIMDHPGELAYLVIADAYDPVSCTEKTVLLSSHGYATGADGSGSPYGIGDHELFATAIKTPINSKTTLMQGGRLGNSAVPTFGALELANADGRINEILGYRFGRRRIRQLVGPAQWIGPSLDEFATVFDGVAGDLSRDAADATIAIRDGKAKLLKTLNERSYLGMGTAVRLKTAGDCVAIEGSASYSVAAMTVEIMIEVQTLGNFVLVNYGWEEGDSTGWELRLLADGAVLFVAGDYNPYLVSEPGEVTAREPHRLSVVARATGIMLYVNGAVVASSTAAFTNPALSAAVPLLIGARQSYVTP